MRCILPTAGVVAFVSCFSPAFRDGTIRCGDEADCPPGLECGADGFCAVDPQLGNVVLTASEGTVLAAGDSVEIALSIAPASLAVPDTVIRLTTDGGELLGPGVVGRDVELTVAADGSLPPVELRAPIDESPGRAYRLTATPLVTGGDDTFSIADPALADVMLEGDQFRLARGFTAEVAVSDARLQNPNRITSAPAASAFPAGVYIAITQLFPIVVRFDGTALETFAASDGVTGPDFGVTQIQFSAPTGPYGDRLYICSASIDAGDGVFTVDTQGDFAVFADFNNCNGMLIDDDVVLDNPGFVPMYLFVNATVIDRANPAMLLARLASGLPSGEGGARLFLNTAPPFDPGLYLLYFGSGDTPSDGFVLRAPDPDPFPQMLDPVLSDLADPVAARFATGTEFGALLYVLLQEPDEIRAFRPNGTSFVFLDGLRGGSDLHFEAPDTLWVTEIESGRLLRIKPLEISP